MMSGILIAEEATIKGSAFNPERIALPKNAVFDVTLEDVSLMDVAAIIMGHTIRTENFIKPETDLSFCPVSAL